MRYKTTFDMRARSMSNKRRQEEKLLETRAAMVRAALKLGLITRQDICKASDMKMHELANLFTADRELYAEYAVMRRTITDTASDNIIEIVNDKTHPKHYDASKYILTTYKSDLDDTLESHDESSLSVAIGGESKAAPVVIRFGKKDKE